MLESSFVGRPKVFPILALWIEEIAEKNNIPGLSNGIKGNTGTVTNSTSVVRVVFIALMAIVSVSAIIAVLSRFTRGKL